MVYEASGKKCIAFVVPEYGLPVPAVQGGAIETLLTMLIGQNEKIQDFKFVVISPKQKGVTLEKETYQFTKVYHLPGARRKNAIQEFFSKVYIKMGIYFPKLFPNVEKYYRRAYRIMKKNKVDYVIAEGVEPRQCVLFSMRFGKENVALHMHHHFVRQLEWDSIFGKYIAVSNFIANEWKKGYDESENISIFQNCVESSRFECRLELQEREQLRESLGFQKDDYVVLFCGRMIPEKGIRELIQAVLLIEDKTVKLLIVGSSNFALGNSGEFAAETEKLIQSNKDKIRYTGYIENHELYRYYQCADVQVIPSLYEEAAGLVALEGALSGLPMIITRSGGMVEYVDEKYTEIVEKDANVSEHLRDKIEFLRKTPQRCEEMTKKAFSYAKKYSKEYYYQQFRDLIVNWEKNK